MATSALNCPLPSTLTSLTVTTCGERFGQIQKMAFRLKQSADTFTEASIILKATWQGYLDSDTATKILVSDYMPNLVLPTSEPATFGGNDNTTINGLPLVTGYNLANGTATFLDLPSEKVKEYSTIITPQTSVGGDTNIEVFFFGEGGSIICQLDSAGKPKGFPLYNFIVSDVTSGGVNQPNIHNITFSLAPKWSENLVVYKPTAFNPLELVETPDLG